MKLKYINTYKNVRHKIRGSVWSKALNCHYKACSGRPRIDVRSYVQWRIERPVLVSCAVLGGAITSELRNEA